jgi:hypothetical protein
MDILERFCNLRLTCSDSPATRIAAFHFCCLLQPWTLERLVSAEWLAINPAPLGNLLQFDLNNKPERSEPISLCLQYHLIDERKSEAREVDSIRRQRKRGRKAKANTTEGKAVASSFGVRKKGVKSFRFVRSSLD